MGIILFPFKVAKHIYFEIAAWQKFLVRAWPDGHLGHQLRWFYWKRKAKLRGRGKVGRMADITFPRQTKIGSNFICSEYSIVNAYDSHGIYIGNNVLLGPRVYIRGANHNFDNLNIPINQQGHYAERISYHSQNYSIVIEDDVWVGANTIILPGVKIGKGSVIGAGSVVTKDIPEFSIAVGSPAKVIKKREGNHSEDILC